MTVLQVDSGTDNGTALSSSEITSTASPSTATSLLTPSSRRKHLLMLQHQQRSSMDTDALDEEVADAADNCPRIVVEKSMKNSEPIPTPPRQFLSVIPFLISMFLFIFSSFYFIIPFYFYFSFFFFVFVLFLFSFSLSLSFSFYFSLFRFIFIFLDIINPLHFSIYFEQFPKIHCNN